MSGSAQDVSAQPPLPFSWLESTQFYNRVQTVTLHAPPQAAIYTTTFTTTFEIYIEDYYLDRWLGLPSDAVTHTATCIPTDPPPPTGTCEVIWGSDAVTFATNTPYTPTWPRGAVYLMYDTRERTERHLASRVISLSYPVGPYDQGREIGLTNTIVFSRSLEPYLQPGSLITPPGYSYDTENEALSWSFTSTPRLEFTATFTEPLLGSDLVIDRLEMSPERPKVGEMVHYTAVVRNQGRYNTGRAVLTELFVRPYDLGAPDVLTDHIGGWSWEDEDGIERGYEEDALFKWYAPAPYQIYLPLVVQGGSGAASTAGSTVELPGSYWWPGLDPGDMITGTTSFPWPDECGDQTCGIWAKVDPAYLDLGKVYDWYGYNPEGLMCQLDDSELPTCDEENNNIKAGPVVIKSVNYLPLVLSNWQVMEEK